MAYGDWLTGPHAAEYADQRGAFEAYYAARDHFERMGAAAKLAEAEARLAKLRESLAPAQAAAPAGVAALEPHRTPRRPRRSTELERRSEWAFETFALLTGYAPLLDLLDDCAKLAKSDPPVLILGESGTGKELIARAMHRLSGRSGPFMAINSGSLPREIIESELFGHVAGAFTGATKDKPGMFEVCDQGTVFLDEIAEMAPELQSRLLRFLETGESRRVGSNKNISVDTRILAATNRERAALERGEAFRVHLYYRLAHAVIALPPLRRRGDDLAMLIPHFLEEACRSTKKRVRVSKEAMARLVSHSWPGNVRQLKSVIKRAVILASEGQELTVRSFELDGAPAAGAPLSGLEQAEKRKVIEALAEARGSRTEAAKALRIPRTTLLNKIRRYGLE
ncbi:MAG: sigma-54-dependent Fis family transcriptional regulator [Candidatus Eisenbacteria bacterium]|nr:sigma-54-dependent Fis family transcriptional regulator [Candidatus Eisenbacteria bacterium]